MLNGPPATDDASPHAPIGGLTALGAAFGLLWSLLLAGDAALGLWAGAATGLLVGIAIDAIRSQP